jgi:pimeloyl-ACP methyl ester carboxylesterase
VTEHRVEVDGRTLCVLETGDSRGQAVFALHGTPGSRLVWHGVVEDAEAKGIRLLTYDRPGYGASDPDPGRNVAHAARDIVAIADGLGIESFGVYGASGGGPHALACATHPERVVAVASLAGVVPWGAEGLDWLDGMGQDNLDEFGAALDGEETLGPYLLQQRDAMLGAEAAALADAIRSLLSPPDLAVLTGELGRFFHDQIATGLAHGIEGWVDDDLVFVKPWGFELDEIRVPVQVWHGVQDRFVPVAHGRWLAERIPGAEEHIYEDEGHLTLQLSRIGEIHDWILSRF